MLMGWLRNYSFLLLSCLFLCACKEEQLIVEGLTQNEANEIIVILHDHEIRANKERIAERKQTTYQIKVAKKYSDQALRILVNNQLPRTFRAGLKEVYPPGSAGLIPTKSDENARLIMALQGESEALLRVFPGVVDARVMLSMDSHQNVQSASVALIYQTGQLEQSDAAEIKSLIAKANSSLLIENIHVVMKELSPKDHQLINPPIKLAKNNFFPMTLLFIITALALMIAAYAFLRPYLALRLMKAHDHE